MDKRAGFAVLMDGTLKKINASYLEVFKKNDIPITPEQWVILEKIYDLGEEASQQEVTLQSYRNKATTSRIIDGLVNKGLIKKNRFEGDLKRFKLEITPSGRKIFDRVYPLIFNLRDKGYDSINQDEFETFIKVLKELKRNFSFGIKQEI